MTEALRTLDQALQAAASNEEHQRALDFLEAARRKFSSPDWGLSIDRRVRDVRTAAETAYAPLKDQAIDAARRGAADAVQAIRARIVRWGLLDLASELDRCLAAAPPAAPEPAAAEPAPAETPAAPPTETEKYYNLW
jgi:hypothetical protein